MITCKELPSLNFTSQDDMFKALIENKDSIIRLKKSAFKHSDDVEFGLVQEVTEKEEAIKANKPVLDPNISEVKVRIVVNTTGLLDSHGDVHVKDIWKRSLDHSNKKLHLQEHIRFFSAVINNEAEAYTKTIRWKTLGFDYEGSTQALLFDSEVKASRNPMMFEQYKNGWVTNHSVGMQYVNLEMCINSEENWSKDYKENWEKYYPMVANKEDADTRGYFWAVTEAKLIEGSAVLMGSNWATPTLDNNMKSASSAPSLKDETDSSTHQEKRRIINTNLY